MAQVVGVRVPPPAPVSLRRSSLAWVEELGSKSLGQIAAIGAVGSTLDKPLSSRRARRPQTKNRVMMQVTEISSQGLQRSYRVVFPLQGVADKVNAQLDDLRTKVQLKGFRRGKAPIAHLRRLYGRSVMGEVIQETVNEASRKIVDEHHVKLAQEPRVKFPEDKALVDAMAE